MQNPFYEGSGRTSKILIADNKIINLTDEPESIKMVERQKNKLN